MGSSSTASSFGQAASAWDREGCYGNLDYANGLPAHQRNPQLRFQHGRRFPGRDQRLNSHSFWFYSSGDVVMQERFLLRKTEGMNDTHVYRWWVPLTYKHRGSPLRKTEWLSTSDISKTINIADANNDEWVLFNVDQQSKLEPSRTD